MTKFFLSILILMNMNRVNESISINAINKIKEEKKKNYITYYILFN